MSSEEPEKPKDQAEVDLIHQTAADSAIASFKEQTREQRNEQKKQRQRRRKPFDEAISRNAQRVYDVRSTDIIFGRGKGYQDHPGNKRMRAIIRQYKEEYNSIHRSRKRDLVESVYSEITQEGARFLHKSSDEDVFVIVDIPIALQKVRNTLRCKKSGMVPTDDDDEVLTSTAAVSDSADGSGAGLNLKSPGVDFAANSLGMQGSLPPGHPATSPVGLMSPATMLAGSQLDDAMLPTGTIHSSINPLPAGAVLGNNLLQQTNLAGLATGIPAGLGGMQFPWARQQSLQGGMPALTATSLAQGYPLMGSMSFLPAAGPTALDPLPSLSGNPSSEQTASTDPPQNVTKI